MKSKSPFFTELSLSEQASLSGGDQSANGGNANANGGVGESGGIAIGGPGGVSKPGKPGRSYKVGKLTKADRKVLGKVFEQVSGLLSALF